MPSPIHIVRLDGHISPSPDFTTLGAPHKYTEYHNTPHDSSSISSRLQDADVVITTRVPISAATIAACPSLRLVAVFAIGCDHVDLEACKAQNVTVCNVPAASNEAVAEHAIALYFALRRNVVLLHELTAEGEEWVQKGSLATRFVGLPGTCREEIMCVLGAGELGKRVANIGKSLGMKVILGERKGVRRDAVREGRVYFEDALKSATVFMITLPLQPSTQNLISATELAHMRPDVLIINIARGGIVNEDDLVQALRTRQIAGAASDVFTVEPAGKENALVRAAREAEWARGRLVLSPHLAWFARSSIEKLRRVTVENIAAWCMGKEGGNLVV